MLELAAAGSSSGLLCLARATAELTPPYAVVDVGALKHNAQDMTRRAAGTTIRLASKSVRAREIIQAVLALPGYSGILGFTVAEAIWLVRHDPGSLTDVVVGYPSADAKAIGELAADPLLRKRITLMLDSVAHLDYIEAAARGNGPVRVCLDLDASLRYAGGRIHLGPRRSPVHTRTQAVALARQITGRRGLHLVGLMCYEGQIAGIGDNQPGSWFTRAQIRTMQRVSATELRQRRAEVVAAVRDIADLEFVNGGGTGSLELTSSEPAVTEIAAGSGLFAPALFDGYRAFHPIPAAYFVLPVVRRPSARIATAFGGGWTASGPPALDRLPSPVWPRGLTLSAREGAGEVQTPLRGKAARELTIADRVWFRHAKAGELCERVNELHLVSGDRIIATVPTYRGEGKAFA